MNSREREVSKIYHLSRILSILEFVIDSKLNRPFYSCGSVTRPVNGSEAAGDFVFDAKLFCFSYANAG